MSSLGSTDTNMAGNTRIFPATNNPVQNRLAQDVLSWSTAEVIATETVTLGSTSSVTSSGSSGRVGDAILFTSGTLNKTIFSITAVSGTTYTLGQIASSAPTGGDSFQLLRYRPALVNSSGAEVTAGAGSGVPIPSQSHEGILGAGAHWNGPECYSDSTAYPFYDAQGYQAVSITTQFAGGNWEENVGFYIDQSDTGILTGGATELPGFTWGRITSNSTGGNAGYWTKDNGIGNDAEEIHAVVALYARYFRVRVRNDALVPVTFKLLTALHATSPGHYPQRVETPRLINYLGSGDGKIQIGGYDPVLGGLSEPANVISNRATQSTDFGLVVRIAQLTSESLIVTERNKTLTTGNVTSSTPGTPVLITALAGQLDITALSNNVGTVYVGASNVNAAAKRGRPLQAGGFYSTAAASASSIYIDVTNSGDGISYNRFA